MLQTVVSPNVKSHLYVAIEKVVIQTVILLSLVILRDELLTLK